MLVFPLLLRLRNIRCWCMSLDQKQYYKNGQYQLRANFYILRLPLQIHCKQIQIPCMGILLKLNDQKCNQSRFNQLLIVLGVLIQISIVKIKLTARSGEVTSFIETARTNPDRHSHSQILLTFSFPEL